MSLRLKTVRSHVQASWPHPTEQAFGQLYTKTIEEVKARIEFLWDKRIPLMIQAYFEDISSILRSLRIIAQADAQLWMVVSTSAYAGIEVPVDLIIAEIGCRTGWYLREVGVLRYLRAAGQHWKQWADFGTPKPKLRESVVIFSARP